MNEMKFTVKGIYDTITELKEINEDTRRCFDQLEKDLDKYADCISPADRENFLELVESIAAESYKAAITAIFNGSVTVDTE